MYIAGIQLQTSKKYLGIPQSHDEEIIKIATYKNHQRIKQILKIHINRKKIHAINIYALLAITASGINMAKIRHGGC